MQDLKLFLDLMFNPGERVCCSTDKFGTHSIPLENVYLDKVTLLSPSPKIPIRQVCPTELIFIALNPMGNGYRNDSNCVKFRNFLVEMDDFERNAQIEYIKHIGLPYSAMVWSGSKSVHTLIALEENTLTEKEYRLLYKWVLNIVTLSDQALGNPSRSIRIPGAIRPETGNIQELIELKTRIKLDDFMAWLNRYPHLRPKEREKIKNLTNGFDCDKLSPWAMKQLKYGIDFSSGRNRAYFGLACDLYNSGFSEDEAVDILTQYYVEENDFKEKEFLITITSAFKYMANKR